MLGLFSSSHGGGSVCSLPKKQDQWHKCRKQCRCGDDPIHDAGISDFNYLRGGGCHRRSIASDFG